MSSALPTLALIDAGVGNLGNVQRALRHVLHTERRECEVLITDDPVKVENADVLVLPGVGAFRPPRERLRGELETALRTAIDRGAALLGICVGYQLLFASSDEYGSTDGLGLLPGRITQLPDPSSGGAVLPHIGWNPLLECADHPLVEGLEGECGYFVHSYAPTEVPPELCLARCEHGVSFPAVAAKDRVMGTQFHPEKSGAVGLGLLRNFLKFAGVTDD